MVSEVQRNTGYAAGLFDGSETDSSSIKDKDSKIKWLAKIIDCVAIDLGSTETLARPLKIVAGGEPERTNAFLQALGKAAGRGDGREAVRKVLNGETPETVAASTLSQKRTSASFDPFASDGAGEGRDTSRTRQEPPSPVLTVSSKTVPSRPVSARRAPPKVKDKEKESSLPEITPEKSVKRVSSDTKGTTGTPTGAAVMGEDEQVNSSDDELDQVGIMDDNESNDPWSATKQTDPNAPSGALVRDMLAAKLEGDNAVERGEDVFGEEQNTGGIILGGRRSKRRNAGASTAETSTAESSNLGADIFADQNEGNNSRNAEKSAGDTVDITAVRQKVQSLVQSTNPLGKAMDALAENAESIQNETRFWKNERVKFSELLIREKEEGRVSFGSNGASSKSAVDEALEATEEEIQVLVEKIKNVRIEIAENDLRIEKVLNMVVAPS